MNEKLTENEIKVLSSYCVRVLVKEPNMSIPMLSPDLVEPLVQQLPNIESGIRPTESVGINRYELVTVWKLASLGYLVMEPIQGHPDGDMKVTISVEGAQILGKTLMTPIDPNLFK